MGRGLSPQEKRILETCRTRAGKWLPFRELLPSCPTESDRASLSRTVTPVTFSQTRCRSDPALLVPRSVGIGRVDHCGVFSGSVGRAEEESMSGTEWTEPGQGSRINTLWDRIFNDSPNPNGIADKALDNLRRLARPEGGGPKNWTAYTNIRLTGEPLAKEIVDMWLETGPSTEPRRVNFHRKTDELDRDYRKTP